MAPPPKPIARRSGPGKLGGLTQDVFGASLFTPSSLPRIHTGTSESLDPFGMADFCASSAEPTQADLETAIDLFDKKILEMKVNNYILCRTNNGKLNILVSHGVFKSMYIYTN